jgi:hypothetical protein
MRRVAKWERSRNRCGLWVDNVRLAYIGKEKGRNKWRWSIDMAPFTCGVSDSMFDAKNEVASVLKEIQSKQETADVE